MCELKSQYGHLRTHQGKWTYSDSGGDSVLQRHWRLSRAGRAYGQGLAAMTDAILGRGSSSAAPRPSNGSKNTGS